VLRAARELSLSLPDSILIGDKPSDIEAARVAGVGRAYRVYSENPESAAESGTADGHYDDLLSCATHLFPAQENPI
jgi:D-glycero-D-manno-heptose 1,7-bisphosphate phosphatase